jgi:hypothetical protein
MKIGSAKYGGEYKRKTYAKLKDGEAMYRILPPLGDLADKGIWSVFWNVHYGYTNSQGKLRTFASPLVRNRKTRMIEVPDAALERIERLKAQLEEAKKSGNKDLANKLTALVSGPKPKFNMDKNHYMNAVDASGNIVILQLRHKAKQALDIEIAALRDKGVDPLGVNTGRYFVFRRTGMGLDTTFKVSVAQETINVPGVGEVKRDIVHALSQDLISRLEGEAGQLSSLYKTPSSAEVARIVTEGPLAVDAILDTRSAAAEEVVVDDVEDMEVPSTTTSPGIDFAKIAQQQTVVQAPVAVAPVAVAPAPAPVAAPAAPVAAMSDEEFLKSMGL